MKHMLSTLLWMWFWTALDQAAIMESIELGSSEQQNSGSYMNIPRCPLPCDTDPCECVLEKVGKCKIRTCGDGGCDQCDSGYFKKDYNYPCVGCNDTFGSHCLGCTDFLGCQQCSAGVRTYDHECGLYFCRIKIEQESSDDSDTRLKSMTPAPTRSPIDDRVDTRSPIDKEIHSLKLNQGFGRIEFDRGCVSHFQVDSVSNEKYNFLVDQYISVQENYGIFESSNGKIKARLYVTHLHDFDRASLLFFIGGGFVIGRKNSHVSKTDTTNLSPFVGNHTFHLLFNKRQVTPHVHVTISIQAYTCDLKLIIPRCCIFVTGMTVDQQTQLGQYLLQMEPSGRNSAFNGEYCNYNGYNGANNIFIQTSKENGSNSMYSYSYQAILSMNDNNFVEFTKIGTDFVFKQYKATYSVAMSQHLACTFDTRNFNRFFRHTHGHWIYSSPDVNDISDTKAKLKSYFDLSHCINT